MSQRARARVPPPPRSRRSLPSAPNKVKGLAPAGRGQGSACEPARELVGGSRGWRALGTQKRSNTRQQQPGLPPARVPGAVHAVQAGFSKLEMAHDKSCPKCHSLFGNHDAAFFFPPRLSYSKVNVPCWWSKHSCLRGVCIYRKHSDARCMLIRIFIKQTSGHANMGTTQKGVALLFKKLLLQLEKEKVFLSSTQLISNSC